MAIKIKEKLCSCGCGKIGRIWSKGMLKKCSMKLNPPKKIQYKVSACEIFKASLVPGVASSTKNLFVASPFLKHIYYQQI